MGSVSCSTSDQHSGPDISLLHPHLQRQWDHAGNPHLDNVQIMPYSNRSVYWVCDKCPLGCPHKWKAVVSNRTNGTQCPFCANKKPCQHNCLATQALAIAAEFSNKNKGTPHDYLVNSSKRVQWQCLFGHEWLSTISNWVLLKSGCPSCAVQQQQGRRKMRHPVLTDSQHQIMQRWDWQLNVKAGLDPSRITCKSQKRANWICSCCPRGQLHRWQAVVGDIFRGSGCPCCSGFKACICNSLQSLAPEVAAEWDYTKNKGTLSDCTASSSKMVWWYNDQRGSFQARVTDRTYVRKAKLGN